MSTVTDPMQGIGQPIPDEGREAGYQCLRSMGFNAGDSMRLVNKVADPLERDRPFVAQKSALASGLDLTGYYRLAATMLSHVQDTQQEETHD